MNSRSINSGLSGPVNKEILNSVIGQLSDGKWENSPVMRKYWQNADIAEENGNVIIQIKDGYGSGFHGKDEAWIKNFFAGKIKEIVYDNLGEERWDRKDVRPLDYLGGNRQIVRVSDAYKAYEILKGRNIKNKYAEDPAPAASVAEPAERRDDAQAVVSKMLDDEEQVF